MQTFASKRGQTQTNTCNPLDGVSYTPHLQSLHKKLLLNSHHSRKRMLDQEETQCQNTEDAGWQKPRRCCRECPPVWENTNCRGGGQAKEKGERGETPKKSNSTSPTSSGTFPPLPPHAICLVTWSFSQVTTSEIAFSGSAEGKVFRWISGVWAPGV